MPDWLNKPMSSITKEMVATRYKERLKVSVSDTNGAFQRPESGPAPAFKHQAELVAPERHRDRYPDRRLDHAAAQDAAAGVEGDAGVGSGGRGPSASRHSSRALTGLMLRARVNELLRLDWSRRVRGRRKLEIRRAKPLPSPNTLALNWRPVCQWRGAAKKGRVFEVDDLRAAFDQVVALGEKQITAHDLRRTFLTSGNRAAAPLITLKKLVNHSDKGRRH